MATTVNPINSSNSSDTSGTSQSLTKSSADLANTQTFLKLLVAQIKNQNPLNPTDGVQFVAQLAQFSELEQTIGIRSDVQALRQQAEGTGNIATGTGTGATGTGATGTDQP